MPYQPSIFQNRALFFTLAFFLLSLPGFALGAPGDETRMSPREGQAIQIESRGETRTISLPGYFKGYLSDTKAFLTSPAQWQAKDWLVAGAVVGVAAGFYAYDQDLKDWAQKRRGDTTNEIGRFTKPFGDGLYTVPALGLLYAYGYATENTRAQRTALIGVEGFVLSGVFTQALKYATHRQRPSDGPRYDRWEGPGFSGSNLSFPSGETTAAFSVATVIAAEYGDTPYVPVAAYGMATLTALARINENAHWASDVLIGAAIGYFTSRLLIRIHRNDSFVILPLVENGQQGVCLVYRF